MDISIVIVSWNVKDKLRECLHSIKDYAGELSHEVFVVDNASKDGSAQMVEKEFPSVHVIANNFNAGFAKANNQAIRLSQGRYVLLLNPDMRLFAGTLEGMVRFMDDSSNGKVGVAGCWLVSPNNNVIASKAPSERGNLSRDVIPDRDRGSRFWIPAFAGMTDEIATSPAAPRDDEYSTVPHVRRFPTLKDQLAIMLKLPHLFPRVLDSYMMKDFDYRKEGRVDSIRGSFFMIRRAVLDKIGLLDQGFFIWFEEVDFCKRAIKADFEVAYTPTVKCIDYIGQSFKKIRFFPKQKMMTRSMLYYFKKHHPWWQYLLLWVLRPFALAAAWVGDKLNMQGKRVT